MPDPQTPLERAKTLVETWRHETFYLPFDLAITRLEQLAAQAIRDAMIVAEDAGAGGSASGIPDLVTRVQALGAQGVWVLRGVHNPALWFSAPDAGDPDETVTLALAPAELVFLARFPVGDGGQPGVEHFG